MKNLMGEIAKLLDVELDEEFEIKGKALNPYKITNEGLFDCNGNIVPVTFRELLLGKYKIVKPLLTKQEKEYLENFLKPYKNEVESIVKVCDGFGVYIHISFNRDGGNEVLGLPYIKEKDFQFDGLKQDKHYAIEELKLFESEQ